MTHFTQYGFSRADVAGAVAAAAIEDLRVNGFSFNGFPQILVSANSDLRAFHVTLSWAEHGHCSCVFELSLAEATAAVKRLKVEQGYDPQIFERVQVALASLEGKAGDAYRQASRSHV
ncbi:hypothetical protein [Luteimonas sp. 100069]|uniref:hypothetical protein n=1 Tax=Luteimonas sp. 100069 TaxID=2006109 RepID=UPI000F4EBA37|nr:hypothetical protein [Luteimonas sp. 100069]